MKSRPLNLSSLNNNNNKTKVSLNYGFKFKLVFFSCVLEIIKFLLNIVYIFVQKEISFYFNKLWFFP